MIALSVSLSEWMFSVQGARRRLFFLNFAYVYCLVAFFLLIDKAINEGSHRREWQCYVVIWMASKIKVIAEKNQYLVQEELIAIV